mgnify:CR=1 FL=1
MKPRSAAANSRPIDVCGTFAYRPSAGLDASAFFDHGTWARLQRVKADYDPDDMFAANHRVPRATVDPQAD